MRKELCLIVVLLLFSKVGTPKSLGEGSYFLILDSYWGSPGNPSETIAGDSNAQMVVSVLYSGQVQITNPRMTLNLPQDFANVTGGPTATSAYQGTVGYGSKMDFTFRISVDKEAAAGLHACNAVMDWATYTSYYDTTLRQVVSELSGTWSQDVTVPIMLHARPILELSIQPAFLVAGRSNNVSLEITNAGSVEIRNLELTITAGTGLALIEMDNKFYVPALSVGVTKSIRLDLFPLSSLAGGMSQVTVASSYRSAYGFTKSETRTLTTPIRGYTEVRLVSLVVPASSSSRYVASGTVANTGMVTIRSLTISVERTQYFSSQSAAFVGDVSVGAQSPYSLQLMAANVRNGTYPITLTMNYKDDFGSQTVTNQTLYIDVTVLTPQPKAGQQEGADSLPLVIRILLLVVPFLAGIAIGYLLFGRKKSEEVD